jgi:hypothetical protein
MTKEHMHARAINMTDSQYEMLGKEARRLQVTRAEVVRRLVATLPLNEPTVPVLRKEPEVQPGAATRSATRALAIEQEILHRGA